jgi:signal transduction histidine kinase
VADDGIGIPPEEVGQLFTRFVRASNARTAGLPGTGLGLSIVKVLVEMHGGHVEVPARWAQGSTSASTCRPQRPRPRATEVPLPPKVRLRLCFRRAAPKVPAMAAGMKARVLVIEDDKDISLGIRTVLAGTAST